MEPGKWQSAMSCCPHIFRPNGRAARSHLPIRNFTIDLLRGNVSGQSASPSKNGTRVLIVDDNEALAVTYAWLLEDAGFTVEIRHNGADALVCVERFRPDVLLLDIGMPVMDGLQLCRTLRAGEAGKDLAIVAQSGYGDDGMRDRTREAGFDRHLVKPIEFEYLLRTLTEVIEDRGSRQSSDDPVGPL